MSRPTRYRLFAITACFGLAVGTRLFPLWWSPLPATLDGLVYAADGRAVVTAGSLSLAGFRADAIASTLLVAMASLVTDHAPLTLVQPLYGIIGAVGVLIGAAFARRLGQSLGWPSQQATRAAVFAAFALAVDGVFVRRTGVPDDDAITLITIPLIVFAAHQVVQRDRSAWLVVLGVLLLALPLTHTFSTLIAALVLIGYVSGAIIGRPLDRGRLRVTGVLGAFCAYFVGYYTWAGSTQLTVPYVDRVQSAFGLFIAWLIILVIVVPWFQRTTPRARRVLAGAPLLVVFTAIVVNAQVTIFPGTAATPRIVLWLVLPLAIPAIYGAIGAPSLSENGQIEPVLIALFVGPVVMILFSFTAGLTPEYFATALRAQTHIHLPLLVVAAGVVARLELPLMLTNYRTGGLSRYVRPMMAVVFVIAMAATLPVAYVNLDTGSYPSTTTESEFTVGTFSVEYLSGQWTSSHTQVRIPGNYYKNSGGAVSPTAQWLRGGPAPPCSLVSQQSWTTTGAHLFPAAPAIISEDRYSSTLAERHQIYSVGGYDPMVITVPRISTTGEC